MGEITYFHKQEAIWSHMCIRRGLGNGKKKPFYCSWATGNCGTIGNAVHGYCENWQKKLDKLLQSFYCQSFLLYGSYEKNN